MLRNLFLIYFFFIGFLKAQNIDHFEIYELNNQAFLTVTISQGSTCDGIIILRSTDSVNYKQVGEIPGVCGSSAEAKSYFFTDEKVEFNKTMYYKIQLGNFLLPNIVHIKIYKALFGAVNAFPNPCKENITFVLDNNNLILTKINVIDLKGNKVLELESNDKVIHVNLEALSPGIYHYLIMNDQWYSGKFILY